MVGDLFQADPVESDLVLSQLGIPDFKEYLREAFSPLRGGWGNLGREEKGKDGKLGLECKIKFFKN